MKAIIDTDIAVRGLVIVHCHLHFTRTISAVTVPLESFFSSNNNKTHANVYGAVIMTKAILRVHLVRLMNAD